MRIVNICILLLLILQGVYAQPKIKTPSVGADPFSNCVYLYLKENLFKHTSGLYEDFRMKDLGDGAFSNLEFWAYEKGDKKILVISDCENFVELNDAERTMLVKQFKEIAKEYKNKIISKKRTNVYLDYGINENMYVGIVVVNQLIPYIGFYGKEYKGSIFGIAKLAGKIDLFCLGKENEIQTAEYQINDEVMFEDNGKELRGTIKKFKKMNDGFQYKINSGGHIYFIDSISIIGLVSPK